MALGGRGGRRPLETLKDDLGLIAEDAPRLGRLGQDRGEALARLLLDLSGGIEGSLRDLDPLLDVGARLLDEQRLLLVQDVERLARRSRIDRELSTLLEQADLREEIGHVPTDGDLDALELVGGKLLLEVELLLGELGFLLGLLDPSGTLLGRGARRHEACGREPEVDLALLKLELEQLELTLHCDVLALDPAERVAGLAVDASLKILCVLK